MARERERRRIAVPTREPEFRVLLEVFDGDVELVTFVEGHRFGAPLPDDTLRGLGEALLRLAGEKGR